MNWYKRSFSVEERNSSLYKNAIRNITSVLIKRHESSKYFEIFKSTDDSKLHTLYFSPTENTDLLLIITDDLESELCDEPKKDDIIKFVIGLNEQ